MNTTDPIPNGQLVHTLTENMNPLQVAEVFLNEMMDFLKSMPPQSHLQVNFLARKYPDRIELIMVRDDFDSVKAIAKKYPIMAVMHLIQVQVTPRAGFMYIGVVNSDTVSHWLFNHSKGVSRRNQLTQEDFQELTSDLLLLEVHMPRFEEIKPVLLKDNNAI